MENEKCFLESNLHLLYTLVKLPALVMRMLLDAGLHGVLVRRIVLSGSNAV
jgi:hypothetical protein